MTTVPLHRLRNSVGATVPAETHIRMGVEVGEDLPLVELVRRNPKLEHQMRLAHEVLREQADALQELARH